MPKSIGILIVEDEPIIAQDLKELLEEAGYTKVYKARNYPQAVELVSNNTIDLTLLDINLSSGISGIEFANYLNRHHNTPFIFITSYSDTTTVAEVKLTRPSGFLLKPYSKAHVLASIEIGLFNFSEGEPAEKATPTETADTEENNIVVNRHLLIKDNYRFIKLALADILWFESDKNYITVKTADKKYLIRSSLKKLLQQLPETDFVKCYKQFIINIRHAETFSANTVLIRGHQIPISRNTQEEVLRKLKQ